MRQTQKPTASTGLIACSTFAQTLPQSGHSTTFNTHARRKTSPADRPQDTELSTQMPSRLQQKSKALANRSAAMRTTRPDRCYLQQIPPSLRNMRLREIATRRLTQDAEATRLGVFVYFASVRVGLRLAMASCRRRSGKTETSAELSPGRISTYSRRKSLSDERQQRSG